jgi:hypothetical protein
MSRSLYGKMPRDDAGAVVIVVAVILTVLLGLGAIVIDAGALYSQRRQIQTAADAAALAGVLELPGNTSHAADVADRYALANSTDVDSREFTFSNTYVANDTITAELRDTAMGLFLARFLGWEDAPVSASATAVIGSPTTYGSGVMPFGILASGTVEPPYGYDPSQLIELVCATGSQSGGNWHYVDLTPQTEGASQTKEVISKGGTTEPLSLYDTIYTQPGSVRNPNFGALSKYFTCAPHGLENLAYDADRGIYVPEHLDGSFCPRLITCPVLIIDLDKNPKASDPYDWDEIGGNTAMTVVGFLNIFIWNDPNHKDDDILYGTFVQVAPDDASGRGAYTDYAGVITWLAR